MHVTGLPTSLRQKHCVDILWLGSVFWAGSNSSPCFPSSLQGLLLVHCAGLSQTPSVPSHQCWLVREGLFALVPLKDHGCRVHPSHLSMPSSGSTKICSFQNYCSVFKVGFSLEGLHFQTQLQTLSVHIFQYWFESPWVLFSKLSVHKDKVLFSSSET